VVKFLLKMSGIGAFVGVSLLPLAMANAKPVTSHPSWCSDPTYASYYAYPTGSYWTEQIADYPEYYAKNNAKFTAKYGCPTPTPTVTLTSSPSGE
jgi:hypothetical protein